MAEVQDRLRAAYPETELMALETEPNPVLLPPCGDAASGSTPSAATARSPPASCSPTSSPACSGMHSKSAPKYGSEKSGAPTNYYITLSPEPVLLTNAELEDVEVVVSPDHKAFIHTNPLKGLVEGGTFILQSDLSPEEVWRELPRHARRTIREKQIRFLVVDAFSVAKKHAPTPDLETRMMGIAFIGAVVGHVDRVAGGASDEAILEKVRAQIAKKFGGKGEAVVEGNMAVIRDGIEATDVVDYDAPEFARDRRGAAPVAPLRSVALSASMCPTTAASAAAALFDPAYYEDLMARPFREGTIGEAPVLPGAGLFMPAGTAAAQGQGPLPAHRPGVPLRRLHRLHGVRPGLPRRRHPQHRARDPRPAPDRDQASSTSPSAQRDGAARPRLRPRRAGPRGLPAGQGRRAPFHEVVAEAAAGTATTTRPRCPATSTASSPTLATYPVAAHPPVLRRDGEGQSPAPARCSPPTIDPWKCTGCLECIEVCGPGALAAIDQDADVLGDAAGPLRVHERSCRTPPRGSSRARPSPDGDLKRLMLDHANFYATTGGHGGCRGCGEVTAIRLVMATSHALGDDRRRAHLRELDDARRRLQDEARRRRRRAARRRAHRSRAHATLETPALPVRGRPHRQRPGPRRSSPTPPAAAASTPRRCRSTPTSTRG